MDELRHNLELAEQPLSTRVLCPEIRQLSFFDFLLDVAVAHGELELVELADYRVVGDTLHEQRLELWHLDGDSQLVQKHWNRQIALSVEYGFAAVLEVGVYLLLGEVEGVGPAQQPVLLWVQLSVLAVVLLLQLTEAQAGVEHQQGVVQVQAVGYGVLGQQGLLAVHPQLGAYPIQVDYTVIDRLLIAVVLADSQSLADAFERFVDEPQLEIHVSQTQNTVVHIVGLLVVLAALLEQVAQRLVEVFVHAVSAAQRATSLGFVQRPKVKGLEVMVQLLQLGELGLGLLVVRLQRVVLQPELELF